MPRPVVIVHGSYHQPEHYVKITSTLSEAGVEVVVPDIGQLALPDSTKLVQQAVDRLAEPPVVVAHSFGGAAAGGLHGIAHIVFVGGWLLDEGQTAAAVIGQDPDAPENVAFMSALQPNDDGSLFSFIPDAAAELFFNGCDEASTRWGLGLLRPDIAANFTALPTAACWHEVPTTYIRMSDDRTWSAKLAELQCARADEVVHLPGGHDAFVQDGRPFAEIIRERL